MLGALAEHRRAEFVVPFAGDVRSADLANAGRTLVMGAGLQLVSWDIGSAEPPGTRLVLPAEEPWEGFRSANASPTEDRTVYTGAGTDGPWVRTVDGDGDVELLPSGPLLDGVPFGVAFTPDGGLLDVFVAAQGEGGAPASPWRLMQIDPSGGAPRDTGIADTLPLSEPDLTADFSEDVSVALVWSREIPRRPPWWTSRQEARSGWRLRPRDVPVLNYLALSSGAAALWEDGAVTLVDRTGRAVQELGVHRAPVRDVALAPDGTWAVTAGERSEVVLWNVDPTTGRWSQWESLAGHDGDVFEVEIDPAGSRAVTVSRDNR